MNDAVTDRNLALEAVRVTEAAAVAAMAHLGGGDERAADEAAVKAMKALLAKTEKDGNIHVDAFRSGLLEFRNTPQPHGFSPAQILCGRAIRSNLLTHFSTF